MKQEVDNIARLSRRVTGLTQIRFCEIYDINVWTLRGWEQGRRDMDQHSVCYLELIAQHPVLIAGLIAKLHEQRQSVYPQAEGLVDNPLRTRDGTGG